MYGFSKDDDLDLTIRSQLSLILIECTCELGSLATRCLNSTTDSGVEPAVIVCDASPLLDGQEVVIVDSEKDAPEDDLPDGEHSPLEVLEDEDDESGGVEKRHAPLVLAQVQLHVLGSLTTVDHLEEEVHFPVVGEGSDEVGPHIVLLEGQEVAKEVDEDEHVGEAAEDHASLQAVTPAV